MDMPYCWKLSVALQGVATPSLNLAFCFSPSFFFLLTDSSMAKGVDFNIVG